MVTCCFDLNLCHMNNFISCVRRINGRPVQRSTTRCYVHDKQAEAAILNFSPISQKIFQNLLDWGQDFTDHKNCIDFFLIRLVKWPKVTVKKWQNLTFAAQWRSTLGTSGAVYNSMLRHQATATAWLLHVHRLLLGSYKYWLQLVLQTQLCVMK